jgi:glycosyltransferase involved in cell wall biosynthesis
LSVSASFAEIYANAGIAKLRVVENGTPALQIAEHRSRSDRRVALGHIGGRSAHKGASLIEATLRRGDYSNLHLTMVDGTLGPGQSVNTQWGTTPVTLTAPFSQSQVAQLYGSLDVLLAPSTWPESFGLVTREALNNGLWVVTSNLGAIGQDVVEGNNGHVIDVTTTQGLSEVLSRIDNDSDRYRERPSFRSSIIRSMADQAAELHVLYQELSAQKGAAARVIRRVKKTASLA